MFHINIPISKQAKVSALSAGIAKEPEVFEGFKPEATEPYVAGRSVVTKLDRSWSFDKEAEKDKMGKGKEKSMKVSDLNKEDDAVKCPNCDHANYPPNVPEKLNEAGKYQDCGKEHETFPCAGCGVRSCRVNK
jgi:hypothetical protein